MVINVKLTQVIIYDSAKFSAAIIELRKKESLHDMENTHQIYKGIKNIRGIHGASNEMIGNSAEQLRNP